MLSDMLQDAHQCVAQPGLILPWETPEMCAIFGPESLVPALPKVAPAPAYETTENASAEGLEDVAPPAVCCLFQRFVVKPVAKKHVLDLNERLYMVAQRFELVLAHAYEASSLGRSIHSKTREARVELVLQALGGKALNTLKARVRVSSNMIAWGEPVCLSYR